MIKKFSILISLALTLGILFFSFSPVFAASNLKGRLLLQVEDKGKVWYVDPSTGSRAYLGSRNNALNVVRSFGIGISNVNLDKIDKDLKLAKRLSGKILLQVEARGEAWYVNPGNLKKYYLGKPVDMYDVMKKLSLGITNKDLSGISILSKYDESHGTNDTASINLPIATTTPSVATSTNSVTPPATPITQSCASWTYSEWSVCDAFNLQTRLLTGSSPEGCIGGSPILSRACELSFNVNIAAGNTPSFVLADSLMTEIIYNIENTSNISSVNIKGITIETNLDTSGATYYSQTALTVYDSKGKTLVTQGVVNNATHELLFDSPMSVTHNSTTSLKAVISGFSGDTGSPHMTVRLLNISSDVPSSNLKGLPVDSNIYRSR